MTDIPVREARASDPKDRAFLLAMAPRLETSTPPWIPPGALAAAVERSAPAALDARREGEAILVAADAEGRGVARALMDAARQWSRDHGMAAMMLRVFCTNTHARAVYERLGYEPDVLPLPKRL